MTSQRGKCLPQILGLALATQRTCWRQGSASAIPALERFLAGDARKLTKRWRKDVQRLLPGRIALLRERAPLRRDSLGT